MRIALLGYGKMGKLMETIALREGWEVGPKLDINDNAEGSGITPPSMEGVDVAIEFSQPEAVLSNIEALARMGVNVVVGTTGWSDQRSQGGTYRSRFGNRADLRRQLFAGNESVF